MRRPPRMHVTPQDPMFDSEAFEQPKHDPSDIDWTPALAGQHSNTNPIKTPLGDPTRWGANGEFRWTGNNPVYVDQAIQVQTLDPYSRNWMLIGNIGVPSLIWTLDDSTFRVDLEVTMGVGQATITQIFNLRAFIDNASAWYRRQSFNYLTADMNIRPFVLAGGLIGRNINARLKVQYSALGSATLIMQYGMLISPLAAGTGI